jgi:hypothetical protein
MSDTNNGHFIRSTCVSVSVLSAIHASLAKYLSERKLFLTKIAERNETNTLSPVSFKVSEIIKQRRIKL